LVRQIESIKAEEYHGGGKRFRLDQWRMRSKDPAIAVRPIINCADT
jgi:hypothetical protein